MTLTTTTTRKEIRPPNPIGLTVNKVANYWEAPADTPIRVL
jgi:hypothetical protein